MITMDNSKEVRTVPGAPTIEDMLTRYEAFRSDTPKPTPEPEPPAVQEEKMDERRNNKPRRRLEDSPEWQAKVAARQARVKELWGDGNQTSLSAVARELNVSADTVRRDLTAMGINYNSQDNYGAERRKKSEERTEAIADLFKRGATPNDIADHTGLTIGSVRQHLNRAGLDWKGNHTGNAKVSLNTVAGNALNEQAILADLLIEQDLDLIHLTEEQIKEWESTAKRVARSLAHVRRRLKKGPN